MDLAGELVSLRVRLQFVAHVETSIKGGTVLREYAAEPKNPSFTRNAALYPDYRVCPCGRRHRSVRYASRRLEDRRWLGRNRSPLLCHWHCGVQRHPRFGGTLNVAQMSIADGSLETRCRRCLHLHRHQLGWDVRLCCAACQRVHRPRQRLE